MPHPNAALFLWQCTGTGTSTTQRGDPMELAHAALRFGIVQAEQMVTRRFVAAAPHGPELNRQLLRDIIASNCDTEYGGRYGFASLATPGQYVEALPLTTYDDYHNDVNRIARGEQRVLTADPVVHLGLSSGTTGAQKMIPLTDRTMKSAIRHMMTSQGAIAGRIALRQRYGRGLNLMNAVEPARSPAGITMGPATASGLRTLLRVCPVAWTSPPAMLGLSRQQTSLYLHLRFGLAYRGLTYVCAPFASTILDMFSLLSAHASHLVRDISDGTLWCGLELPDPLRRSLQALVRPDPQRARELDAALNPGFDGCAGRVWPLLAHISTITGGPFSVYADKLQQYLGPVPIFASGYGATEAMIAVSLAPETLTYVINPRTAFYEFIPIEDAEQHQPGTIFLEALETGRSYEIVLTTPAGLYRYRLGDIVTVVGHVHQLPVIEFQYRLGQLLSIAGEKTSEQAACAAAMTAMRHCGLHLEDYSTLPDYDHCPGRYVLFLEARESGAAPKEPLQPVVDAELGRSNPRYRAAREDGRLGPPVVHLVRPGAFADLKALLVQRGASPNQVKTPRVIRNDDMHNLLMNGCC